VSSLHVCRFVHPSRDIPGIFEEIIEIFEYSGLPIISGFSRCSLDFNKTFVLLNKRSNILHLCEVHYQKREREREILLNVSINISII